MAEALAANDKTSLKSLLARFQVILRLPTPIMAISVRYSFQGHPSHPDLVALTAKLLEAALYTPRPGLIALDFSCATCPAPREALGTSFAQGCLIHRFQPLWFRLLSNGESAADNDMDSLCGCWRSAEGGT
ncbi:hypothetical protein FBULB1_11353 [Fusarium bulbicola]|nr:hypothetical protein FBULB1_11353 [Fusarium bulbicola]